MANRLSDLDMNPLDKEELKAFFKIVKKDMPIHTDETAKMKRSYSQGLPKNIMDYSQKIDNEFLNNNLHTIEEMEYRKKGITNDFKNYQNKYYDDSGILNHDLYFNHDGKIYPKVSGASPFIMNPSRFGAQNGITLATNATDDVAANTANELVASRLETLGTVGHLYDQVAVSVATASGNYHVGSYDGSDTVPNNRDSTTGSITVTADYALKSVTEFALSTTRNWGASVTDNNTTQWHTRNAAVKLARYGTGSTIADPWSDISSVAVRVSKIAHS